MQKKVNRLISLYEDNGFSVEIINGGKEQPTIFCLNFNIEKDDFQIHIDIAWKLISVQSFRFDNNYESRALPITEDIMKLLIQTYKILEWKYE